MPFFLWSLFALVVLAFPSSNLTHFDGLPFSSGFEVVSFLLILPILLFAGCRDALERFFRPIGVRLILVWALPALLLFMKVVLLVSGARAGWEACYRSSAEPVDYYYGPALNLPCERSYENAWGLYPATRMQDSPYYQAGITIPIFINTLRYDYYDWESGTILRNRFPIDIRWKALVMPPPATKVEIRFVGEGVVHWGAADYRLAASYKEPTVVSLPAPVSPAAAPLYVEYHFNDGSRSGQDSRSWGPDGFIQLTLPVNATVVPSGWAALGGIIDIGWLLLTAVLLSVLAWSVRADWLPLCATVAAAVILWLPASPLFLEFGLISLLAGVFLWHNIRSRMKPASLFFVVVLISLCTIKIWYPAWNTTALRSAGNDPLGFESQAYAILAGGNLEGGESVFYAQPFYRYIKFLEHICFGDGDVLYAGMQLAIFLGGVFFLFSKKLPEQTKKWNRVFWLAMGCVLLYFGGYYVAQVIRDELPEYVTWIVLIWAVPMLFLDPSPAGIVAGMAALAVAGITRTNQLPGVLFLTLLAGFLAWPRRRAAVLAGAVLALVILLFPLAHNLWFGHEAVLFTTSPGLATNLTAPPAVWQAGLAGDPAARGVLQGQLSMLFLVSAQPRSMYPTMAAIAFCAFFYGITFFRNARRREFSDWFLLAVPVFYLGPHLFYVVSTYYPRHIIAIYLSMAVVAAVLWARKAPDRASLSLR